MIARIEEAINTAEKLRQGIEPNMADIVIRKIGWQPEYYQLFLVYQVEPDSVQGDPTNHYHFGVIASNLVVYDLGLDVMFE